MVFYTGVLFDDLNIFAVLPEWIRFRDRLGRRDLQTLRY